MSNPEVDFRIVNGVKIDPDSLRAIAGLSGFILVKVKTLRGEEFTLSCVDNRAEAEEVINEIVYAFSHMRLKVDGCCVEIQPSQRKAVR